MWREIFLSRAPTTSLSPSGVCAHLAGDAGLQFKTDSAVTSVKPKRRWEGASAGLWGARRWGRTWAEACVPACCRTPGAAGRCSAWLGAGHGGRRRVCRHVRLVLAGALRHAPRPKLRRGRPRLGPRPALCSHDQEARRPLPHLVPCPHWAAHSANVYGRQGRARAGSGPRRHKSSSWP